jgi:probable F420-dependent oxidoreductase
MVEQRPFRFGVMHGNTLSRAGFQQDVQRAEEFGYATFSAGDHVFHGMASQSALAFAAAVTSTIRIGALTFANDLRNPVMLAREVATIDMLSNGRFEFGIGSGYSLRDYTWTGISLDAPGTRIDRLIESVGLLKRVFTEDNVALDGTHYSIDDVSIAPKPVQQPWPPFVIGGGGKRVLQFAAREADIVGIGLKSTPDGSFDWDDISPDAHARKVQWVREASGDRWGMRDVNILINVCQVGGDPEAYARRVLDAFKAPDTVTVEHLLASPYVLVGNEDEIIGKLQRLRETSSVNYVTVRSEFMESFAPIVARLAGT